jgi:hypothetical protein
MGDNHLDGDENGVAGGKLVSFIGRGRRLNYVDSTGDAVSVSLSGGGFMEVWRRADGEGRFLTLTQTVSGKSALKGTVSKGGTTHFDALRGTAGVNLKNFKQPPFIVGSISAVVVDSVLGGTSASSLLAESMTAGKTK